MIKILITGPEQSGSTRIYNFLRILLDKLKLPTLYGWDIEIPNNNNYKYVLSKLHECNKSKLHLFDHIILPLRDMRDSYISTVKRCPNKKDKSFFIKKNIKLFENTEKNSTFFLFLYELYNIKLLKKLCDHLSINVDYTIIIETMKDLEVLHNSKNLIFKDNMGSKWKNESYCKTLLTQSHNTSGGKIGKYIDFYNIDENNYILEDKEIKLFLEKYNYLELEFKLRMIKSNLIL